MNKVSLKLYQIIILESSVSKDSSEAIPGYQLRINENQPPFECFYCSEICFDFDLFKIHLIQCESISYDDTNYDKEPAQLTIPKTFNERSNYAINLLRIHLTFLNTRGFTRTIEGDFFSIQI